MMSFYIKNELIICCDIHELKKKMPTLCVIFLILTSILIWKNRIFLIVWQSQIYDYVI
jgi:hypothetical protein